MVSKKKKRSIDSYIDSKVFLILYLLIIVFTFFKVYPEVFDKKIDLGGDNASYYILGQSLATGQGYRDIQSIEKEPHNHFPPGYPAIVAVASKFFSNDILFIKKVNGFFLIASVLVMFFIVKEMTESYHVAFVISMFTLLNYHMLHYSNIMMSEMSFIFFSLISIWLMIKMDFEKPLSKNWMFLLLIITVTITYYIRSTGIALLGTLGLILLLKKQWKYLTALVSGFIVFVLPWFIRNGSMNGNSYVNQLIQKNPYRPEMGTMQFGDWFVRIGENVQRYLAREIPSGILDFVSVEKYGDPIKSGEYIIGVIALALIIFGFTRFKRHRNIVLFYVLATFVILLVWPSVWFGVRFLIPLIPLLTFALFYGLIELIWILSSRVFNYKNRSVVYLVTVVLCLFSIKSYSASAIQSLKDRARGIYVKKYRNYFEMAKWIDANAPDTSVTCCRKGTLFYLYSHKYVTGFKNTLDPAEQIEYLKSRSTDYVVLSQLGYTSTGRYLFPAVKRYPQKFPVVKKLEDPETYLLQFKPNWGYWGDFKDDQRSGHGTFTWANGNHFEGEWKDNTRNGKGVLYLSNGNMLAGTWRNDSLNGEAVVKNKAGLIIKRSVYKDNEVIKELPVEEQK